MVSRLNQYLVLMALIFVLACGEDDPSTQTDLDKVPDNWASKLVAKTDDSAPESGAVGAEPTPDQPAQRFKELAAELDQLSRGVIYKSNAGLLTRETMYYRGKSVTAEPDGALRITLDMCKQKGTSTSPTGCLQGDAFPLSVTLAPINMLDPESIRVQGFSEEGKALPETKKIGITVDGPNTVESDLYTAGKSFVAQASCKSDKDCVRFLGIGLGSRLYIPCDGQAECTRTQAILRDLSTIAAGANFDAVLTGLMTDTFPDISIVDMETRRRTARNIAGRFANGSFRYDGTDQVHYVAQTDVELPNATTLAIFNQVCQSSTACDGDNSVNTMTLLHLENLDVNNTQVLDLPDRAPFVNINCKQGFDCVSNSFGGKTTKPESWLLTCTDVQACGASLADLRSLAWAVSKKSGAGARQTTGDGAIQDLLARLNKGTNAWAARVVKLGKGEIYSAEATQKIDVDQENNIVLRKADCFENGDPEDGTLLEFAAKCDPKTGDGNWVPYEVVIASKNIDLSTLQLSRQYEGVKGARINFACKADKECLTFRRTPKYNELDQECSRQLDEDQGICDQMPAIMAVDQHIRYNKPVLSGYNESVECRDVACKRVFDDFRLLIERTSGTNGSEKSDAKPVTQNGSSIPSNLLTPLTTLSNASKGGELAVVAAANGSLRMLRGEGAHLDADHHLHVKRKACLALINPQAPKLVNCDLDSLMVDYDLHIYLGRLDPDRVTIAQARHMRGETGFWVGAACARGWDSCADIVIPKNKKGHVGTVMAGFDETERSPKIRIPCANTTKCNEAAQALRALMTEVGPEAASAEGSVFQPITDTPTPVNEFVGTWQIQSPAPQGWVWQFRADNTYTFITAETSFEGTYKASNGKWEQKAINFASDDAGTYRLIDKNTLQLTGRLGTSIWKRL